MTLAQFCPQCGTAVGAGGRFCASCGASLEGGTSGGPAPTQKPGSLRVVFRVVAIIAIVLASLYLLNNTTFGLGLKCRVLGDVGACLMVSLDSAGPQSDPVQDVVEDILDDIGRDI